MFKTYTDVMIGNKLCFKDLLCVIRRYSISYFLLFNSSQS